MIEQRDVVRLLAPQLLKQRHRLVHPAGDEVRGRILQPNGEAAAELHHLVGPRIGPDRFAQRADGEREVGFLVAAEAAVGGAEQPHRVPIAGMVRKRALEHVRRLLILRSLQVDARQAS